jgi:ParB-like chromosome segregation protein Spo0J
MPRPAKVPAALLIEDLSFWPRYSIDGRHVNQMAEAIQSGKQLPAVVAERTSKRIVDGFHRTRAVIKANGPDAEIEVFWRTYKNDAEMFKEAIRLNASHGRKLTPFDHARITQRAKELGISMDEVAIELHIRITTLKKESKFGLRRSDGKTAIPLKRPLRHLADEVLTPEQEAYNEVSDGWTPRFHARQLIYALEAGLPEITESFAIDLTHLAELIDALELDVGPAAEAG